MMTENNSSKRSMKYDKKNTRDIRLKFNIKTDADILEYLDTLPNKQGKIKELLRKEIEILKSNK